MNNVQPLSRTSRVRRRIGIGVLVVLVLILIWIATTADYSSPWGSGFDLLGAAAFVAAGEVAACLWFLTRRARFITVGTFLLAYVGSYVALSASGGYYFSQSGQRRYSFGLAMSDRTIWHPAWTRWESFRRLDGRDTSRGTPLGYFYSPLIWFDRQHFHPTSYLFEEQAK